MSKYILRKEDRIVTLSKVEDKWNYRKEFGSTLIENFDFTEEKLVGFLKELTDIGYKKVEKINIKKVNISEKILEARGWKKTEGIAKNGITFVCWSFQWADGEVTKSGRW